MSFQFIKNQYQSLQQLVTSLINQNLEENRRNFLDINPSQSESDFLATCFLEFSSSKQEEVAIAIRRAIAKLGNIESEFIRAEVSFEDLDLLPFWNLCGDAGFNSTIFIEAIQSELHVHFTEERLKISPVKDPDLNIHMKIHEFVNEFYYWYDSLST